jgi:TonB family protein
MSRFLVRLLVAMCVFFAPIPWCSAQSSAVARIQENFVVTNLFKPVYPPLAKQTRITGDVVLTLKIRKDGRLESATVVSGHPLLKQAALDSAERSQFECRNCSDEIRPFQMLYSFQLGPTSYCAETSETSKSDEKKQFYPRVLESQNHVTVIDQPVGTCDLGPDVMRVRSAKCLYLWRCSLRSL